MKPLPRQFNYRGWSLYLVKRSGNVAIYAKSKPDWPDGKVSYEVVRIREQQAKTITIGDREVFYEHKEIYPPDTAWGTDGFTLNDLHAAHEKFDEMLNLPVGKSVEGFSDTDEGQHPNKQSKEATEL